MQKQQSVAQRRSLNRSNFNIVLENLRSQLSARGASTIRGLSRVFKNIDSYNGNRKIDAQELYTGLKEIGLTISKQDIDVKRS